MERVGREENWVGLNDRLPAFARDPGSPRTDVLGNSQPSLRDWSQYAGMAGLFSASAVRIGFPLALSKSTDRTS